MLFLATNFVVICDIAIYGIYAIFSSYLDIITAFIVSIIFFNPLQHQVCADGFNVKNVNYVILCFKMISSFAMPTV